MPEEQEEATAKEEGDEIAALEWLGGRHVTDDARVGRSARERNWVIGKFV